VDSSLQRPACYLGNELGVIIRDWQQEWDEAHVRWCLNVPGAVRGGGQQQRPHH